MFEYTDTIMKKIENNEQLNNRERGYIERALKLIDCYEQMLNEVLGLSKENHFELKYPRK